ncbi:ribosome hibernation-promoting factor, HPF/YfiA family [Cupriavidus sp. AU9028]|uniref:ribosome hibernation-promoting factor, HPF/YfiA family n=1 Tax=Cupriavidus sp. AU9028 TaxID=2871157 RepID=UPI001C965B1A|nr:ribosome-associated translation inhibitor RaiA [Cupriavidus sp. AU9028]MBY4896523.1 ribosome-associated translation inhibitor RaiA [Cupriavidus sp. AU9028]
MNLKISGHHLDITPPLREYVETKLERIVRHFDQVTGVTVLLSLDNQKEKDRRQRAEVILSLKGKDIFVETQHEDLYAAIDMVVDKLDRQVIRYKDKVQGHDREAVKYQMAAAQMQQ